MPINIRNAENFIFDDIYFKLNAYQSNYFGRHYRIPVSPLSVDLEMPEEDSK